MKIAPGIRETVSGFEAYIRIAGRLRTKHFKRDTKLVEMVRWRELQRVAAHYKLPAVPTGRATFADDVLTYLGLVAGMPTIADRTYRMEQWADVFGGRDRHTITALEIRAQLEQWRVKGHAGETPKGLSAGSLNQRRTALLHFYSVLNGRDGVNPVRAVPPYREPERVWRLPTREQAERAIAAVAHGRWPKHKGTKTQARLRVLLHTGWPSAILKQLQREDLNLPAGTAILHGRRKGRGTPPRTLPLSPAAVIALRAFDALDAYGPFSGSALHSALQRGCARAKVTPFRVYDLRHRFITTVVAASPDERGASELALHADPRQTRRYSRQAASERAKAALEAAFPTLPTLKKDSLGRTRQSRTTARRGGAAGTAKKPKKKAGGR